MKQTSGKEFIRIIQKRGWILKRINGSHHIFSKEGHRERIVIPVHRQPAAENRLVEASDENRRSD